MITSFINRSFQNSASVSSATSEVADTGLIVISETIAGGAASTVSIAYDDATAVAVYVQVDQDGTTINPGSGTSATLTFTDATIPYLWQENCNYVNVWNDAFTDMVVTNGSATEDCILNCWIVYTV